MGNALTFVLGDNTALYSEGFWRDERMWSREQVDRLYRQCYPAVVRRAQTLVRNTADANDIAQEVFASLVDSAAPYRGDSSALTFLFSLTTNQAISRLRKRLVRDDEWEQAVSAMWPCAIPPTDPTLAADARRLVTRVLRSDDEVLVQIVIGHCLDGMSQGEVAELLGLSRVTVNQRLQAFRAELRASEAAI
jgi:RNA polymerase sigma factor (sigma-70 family)